MKHIHFVCLLVITIFSVTESIPQPRQKAVEESEREASVVGTTGILDRAGGLHNKSNIGEFFENRGKLNARYTSQGPSGEFPIGSTQEYIYRMNPMVGVPNNVVQGRYPTNEEWEAAAGYHNRDLARVAFSDNPSTWPATGWPVKDGSGNPIFVSDQDSYCVYNDSNNTRPMLRLQVNQTGYAFSLEYIRDMIFFTFDIVNKSDQAYDSLYFGMYMDIDVGNSPGGVPEYEDDKMGFNRDLQLAFFYDDGLSPEWPGGTTGYFGMAMLQTPLADGVRPGVTDFHYNLYDDDLDRDTVQYGIMSSAPSLFASSLGPLYFHLGNDPPNLHFDDTTTIPGAGLDILATMSSGPYTINPGDTLRFVTVMVAGNTRPEIFRNTHRAYDLFAAGYARPEVTGGTGTIGFQLGLYGRVRLDVPVYPGAGQLDRLSFVAALNSTSVFDYTEDAENVEPPRLTTGGIADTIATVLTDNSYSNLEPDIRVRATVYSWHNDDFFIVKYTTTNIHASPYTLFLGAFVDPKPGSVSGGETVAYDATKKVSYCFRTGQNPHIGLKTLSGDPFSFHVLNWEVGEASDSTRYWMTATPGFDGTFTAGPAGSVFNLNAGERTIAPGDSATVYYAVIYTTNLSDLLLEADSAQIRYDGTFTGVTHVAYDVPEEFALYQNHPNPFNPTTSIKFKVPSSQGVTLKVYDVLGREVATLVDEVRAPGTYTVQWDASGVSSGVYFYRLQARPLSGGQAGAFAATRKLLLLR